MKINKVISLISILTLLVLPLVSAYNGFGYYWYSPSQLLDNEWFVFGLIFVVFFAITFFALGRTMAENRGAATIISIIVALFIAVAISRRTYFYGYLGEQIGSYLLILALILGAIILIKFLTGIIGGIGLFIALFGLWFVLSRIDPYNILPYEFLTSNFYPYYEFLAGTGFLILLIIAFVIVLIAAYNSEKVKNWLWCGSGKESILERLAKTRVR